MTDSSAFRALVRRYGADATAEQTLNRGMRHWTHGDAGGADAGGANAGVAYAVSRVTGRRVWVTAGGPVCAPAARAATMHAFEAAAGAAGARVVWFAVDTEAVAALGPGHAALVVGAEPEWSPARWAEAVDGHASLRRQVRRAGRQGVVVREEPAAQAAADAGVRDVLAFWLATRGMGALSFLADPHVLDAPGDRRAFVARTPGDRGGRAVGVLWLAPIPARDGWLAEWVWRGDGAPNGVTDALVDAAVRQLAAEGAAVVSLGLVPLASVAPPSDPSPSAAVRALMRWMRAHARRFYRFDGLERFKAKYRAECWRPMHVATPGAHVGLTSLAAVADVFAARRGLVPHLTGALAQAAREEAQTARARLARGSGGR